MIGPLPLLLALLSPGAAGTLPDTDPTSAAIRPILEQFDGHHASPAPCIVAELRQDGRSEYLRLTGAPPDLAKQNESTAKPARLPAWARYGAPDRDAFDRDRPRIDAAWRMLAEGGGAISDVARVPADMLAGRTLRPEPAVDRDAPSPECRSYYRFSAPVILDDVAFVRADWHCFARCGEGGVYVLLRDRGRWRHAATLSHWVG